MINQQHLQWHVKQQTSCVVDIYIYITIVWESSSNPKATADPQAGNTCLIRPATQNTVQQSKHLALVSCPQQIAPITEPWHQLDSNSFGSAAAWTWNRASATAVLIVSIIVITTPTSAAWLLPWAAEIGRYHYQGITPSSDVDFYTIPIWGGKGSSHFSSMASVSLDNNLVVVWIIHGSGVVRSVDQN